MTLLRGALAAPPRTLVDVLRRTAADHPDEPALDNGAQVLTYEEFLEAAEEVADDLRAAGIGPGDHVGVRIRSGTVDLYVAIAGILLAGAAYVPVDADDPDERARTVFGEAGVAAVLSDDLELTVRRPRPARTDDDGPSASDTAWVIFTSGSTPGPSQFVFVIGLIARPVGTNILKCGPSLSPPPGLAPPPVASPTIVARFRVLRLFVYSSAPEKVRRLVSTYTGLLPYFGPGT